jgi:spore maturation protein CgeB
MKKILFVGDLNLEARAYQRYLTMKELGFIVLGLSLKNPDDSKAYPPSFQSRILYKLGYPLDRDCINIKIISELENYKPDLIWIEKVNTLWLSTYLQIKKQYPKLKIVYYSEDDIYLRHNRSVYLKQSLPIFDLVFTTKPRNITELPLLGVKKVFCVYQSYDRNIHKPIEVTAQDVIKWGSDVSFVGTFEQDRASKMLYLAQQGIKIRVWGSNWQRFNQSHPNLRIEKQAVYNQDFIKVLCSSKINLNFLRKANRDQHTSRSLEIPACKAFMLAERTDEHLQLFEEGKEAEFFDSETEFLGKIRYYLASDKQRQQIAHEGRQRCLDSGYDHHSRLKVMLGAIYEQ